MNSWDFFKLHSSGYKADSFRGTEGKDKYEDRVVTDNEDLAMTGDDQRNDEINQKENKN